MHLRHILQDLKWIWDTCLYELVVPFIFRMVLLWNVKIHELFKYYRPATNIRNALKRTRDAFTDNCDEIRWTEYLWDKSAASKQHQWSTFDRVQIDRPSYV